MHSSLFRLDDPLNNFNFLVDTAAEVSVIPATASQRSLPQVTQLFAANGTVIPVYKRRTLHLELNLRRSFPWTFYVAGVNQAILGADFLTRVQLARGREAAVSLGLAHSSVQRSLNLPALHPRSHQRSRFLLYKPTPMTFLLPALTRTHTTTTSSKSSIA